MDVLKSVFNKFSCTTEAPYSVTIRNPSKASVSLSLSVSDTALSVLLSLDHSSCLFPSTSTHDIYNKPHSKLHEQCATQKCLKMPCPLHVSRTWIAQSV